MCRVRFLSTIRQVQTLAGRTTTRGATLRKIGNRRLRRAFNSQPRSRGRAVSKKMTTRSLPEIGRRFANRDHTTVIHAVKTITRLSEKDDEMKKNIEQLRSLLLEEQNGCNL